jgi:hypothetical protein
MLPIVLQDGKMWSDGRTEDESVSKQSSKYNSQYMIKGTEKLYSEEFHCCLRV